MRDFQFHNSLHYARLACLLAGALGLGGMVGCCGPCGPPPVCGAPGDAVHCPPGCPRGHGRHSSPHSASREPQECLAAGTDAYEPRHGPHRKPIHRLAHHLKPDGPMQPQVPMPPLPKFHPLPVKPVFEPGYFDTAIGPAEAPPPYGPAELAPIPTPTPRDF